MSVLDCFLSVTVAAERLQIVGIEPSRIVETVKRNDMVNVSHGFQSSETFAVLAEWMVLSIPVAQIEPIDIVPA